MRFLSSLFVIVTCFNTYDTSSPNYTLYKKHILRNSWTSITSPGRIQDSHSATVYLGYANNPFGSSARVFPKKSMYFTHLEHGKKQILEIPPSKPTKFEHMEDSGRNRSINMQEQRPKRGVLHLYNMVSCATGCNPLIYKGYGCYCGFLGSGYAVDGIDRCCQLHDWCYDNANCPMFLEYFVPYYWKCYRNTPLCAVSEEQWGGRRSCAYKLCECDRILSECFSRYPCPSSRALCRSSTWRFVQNAFMIF